MNEWERRLLPQHLLFPLILDLSSKFHGSSTEIYIIHDFFQDSGGPVRSSAQVDLAVVKLNMP